jgi:hypothetical protein
VQTIRLKRFAKTVFGAGDSSAHKGWLKRLPLPFAPISPGGRLTSATIAIVWCAPKWVGSKAGIRGEMEAIPSGP